MLNPFLKSALKPFFFSVLSEPWLVRAAACVEDVSADASKRERSAELYRCGEAKSTRAKNEVNFFYVTGKSARENKQRYFRNKNETFFYWCHSLVPCPHHSCHVLWTLIHFTIQALKCSGSRLFQSLYNSRGSSGVCLRAHFRMMMSSDLCLSEMNSVACHGPEVVSPSVNKVQKVGEDNAK